MMGWVGRVLDWAVRILGQVGGCSTSKGRENKEERGEREEEREER